MNREDSVGLLAVSKAGHDKNEIFVIVREEGEYVWLADGQNRSVLKPKKKKKKHISLIKYFSDKELLDSLQLKRECTDLTIKGAIKAYRKALQEG